jgi:hypothetical protein
VKYKKTLKNKMEKKNQNKAKLKKKPRRNGKKSRLKKHHLSGEQIG